MENEPKIYCDCKETKRFKMKDGGIMCYWFMDINNNLGCIVCELPVKPQET